MIAALTVGLFAIPVLADLLLSDRTRVFGYLAPDAFYYLTVARNIVEHASVSFDQIHGTNGFHPLWQFSLAALYGVGVLARLSEPHIMSLGLFANVAAIAVGLWLLAAAFADEEGRLSSLFLILPVGIHAVWLFPVWLSSDTGMSVDSPPLAGTLWMDVNGMESSFVILFYAAAAWAFVRKRPLASDRDAILLGILFALFTLARLDHGLIAGGICSEMFIAAAWQRDRGLLRRVLLIGVAFALPMIVYCAVNRYLYGTAMPVSGSLKSSFPAVNHQNLQKTYFYLLHPLRGGWWRLYREAQMVVPALFAIAFYVWVKIRRSSERIDRFLAMSAPGVVALALYDDLFVELAEQGHWYFPVSTLYVSLVTLRFISTTRTGLALSRGRAAAACATILMLAGVGCFFRFHLKPTYNRRFAEIYSDVAPRVRAFYGERVPRMLEVADGIIAFSTGFPSMAGKGYTLDPEAVRAMKRGVLMDLALARGFDRVSSLGYFDTRGLSSSSPSDFVASRVAGDPKRYSYAVEFVSDDFLVMRLAPRR